MTSSRVDLLMITYNSPYYVRLSLPRLLETCREDDRVWLWHNGDDEETLAAVRQYVDDPRVACFHHSRENVRLRPPTNWLYSESTADFVSKVDDDCLVSYGWIEQFAEAHDANPQFGVVASWRHPDEDFMPELARRKIVEYAGGHRLMRNLWVQGSGYLLPRHWVQRLGPLRQDESFTQYCIRLARAGGLNGWYYPFVREDHMDDPRSPHTILKSDADLPLRLPLSAQANGVRTLAAWEAQLRQSAVLLQSASLDLKHYGGWRAKATGARRRIQRALGVRVAW